VQSCRYGGVGRQPAHRRESDDDGLRQQLDLERVGAGLGNVPSATFSLEGTVDVSSRCYTKSGNKPQAANEQESINVSQTKTFDVRNGRTNATLHRDAALDADLPGGQHAVIESVTFDLAITSMGDTLYTFSS
jgi:hypothetical protein